MKPHDSFRAGLTGQLAHGNSGPVVQIAGYNTGPINISRRPKLTVSPVSRVDRESATEPLWACSPTPRKAFNVIQISGFVVIIGEQGSGRRISSIRAMQEYFSFHKVTPELFNVAPDWGDDETVDSEILPDPLPRYGYLIDVTSRTLSPSEANDLTTWGEALHPVGSCAVIVANRGEWPGEDRFEVTSSRPNPVQVARNHLAERLKSPIHANWLQRDSKSNRFSRHDPTVEILSDLITPSVSPSDAVAIAERLYRIPPERVNNAVGRYNGKQPSESLELRTKELQTIRDEVLLWTHFLEKTLTESGTRGHDRVMLLSAAYLEGAPLEVCIKAADKFVPRNDAIARRYREGRSPRRRMREVGVDITPDDRAAFSRRPGLALSAIRVDWHHWVNERQHTRAWIERITEPGGAAEDWAEQLGERLLELSRTAVDPPFFAVLEHWINFGKVDERRLGIIANLLTKAAQTDELMRETHKTLLEWAKKNAHQRKVVALVCTGKYGRQWPGMALVRLRHIFAHDDDASKTAAKALVDYAVSGNTALTRIVETVESWLDKHPEKPSTARAFLAVIDPLRSNGLVTRLITLGQKYSNIRDFLIRGWTVILCQMEVREEVYQVLLGWAQAIHEDELNRKFTLSILADVRNAHTPVDALSRFLYGNPDREDPALISTRIALANLQSYSQDEHSQSEPDNRLTLGTAMDEGAAADVKNAGDDVPKNEG